MLSWNGGCSAPRPSSAAWPSPTPRPRARRTAPQGVTLTLQWEEYRAAHPGERTWGFTQFCEHYKRYARTLKRSLRPQHRASKKLFMDCAGPTLALADGGHGPVFVSALGASSYTFACVTADQSMRSWLGAIDHALRFIGGVPQMIVPDNARAVIAEPTATSCAPTTPRWTSRATTTYRSCRRVPTPSGQGQGGIGRAAGRALDPGAAAPPAAGRRAGRRPSRERVAAAAQHRPG